MMRRLREIPCRMLALTAVQPCVLVALIQSATIMATEVVKVANESEEDVRFRDSGGKPHAVCGFLVYFCAVLLFSDPPCAPFYKESLVTVP